MKARVLPWLAALVAIGLPGRAVDFRERSESSTKQFVVFSTDVRLRQRVASYAEELKVDVLKLLGEADHWKTPIVLTLERASTAAEGAAPARFSLVDTPGGQKIEINVKIGADPAAVNLQKLLVRALLLEFAYRGTVVLGGSVFVEAPWWVVEGLIEMERRRNAGTDGEIFRRLVETNHLPAIESFLQEKPDELGPTALALDRALAMGLLQMFVEQPGGRESLVRLIREWPRSNGDPMALLTKEFPAIAGDQPTLQKWWVVNLARFAAADRYEGLTVEQTDKVLQPLLQIECTLEKTGEKKTFAIADFSEFLKHPSSRAALAARHGEIIDLSARANLLFRPIIADYEQIVALLVRGKSHGVRDRLAKVEEYRALVLHRASEIADYLNWFEGTQLKSRSQVFDNYLRTANEISEQDRKDRGPIGRYLDDLELEF